MDRWEVGFRGPCRQSERGLYVLPHPEGHSFRATLPAWIHPYT